MTRSAASAVLCALAVLAAALPLRALFEGGAWFHHVLLAVAVVVAAGVVVRAWTRSALLLLLTQTGALALTLTVDFARDTLAGLLPTPATLSALSTLLTQSRETIMGHSAPAPMNDGVAFSLALIIGMVAITADLCAATGDSPVAAGLPIGALFAISAANSSEPLHWFSFALPAALWMFAVAAHASTSLHRWVSLMAGRTGEDHDGVIRRDFGHQAVGLTVAALTAALIAPALIPHLPPTAIGDGLRGSQSGPAAGRGQISLSSEIDLRRSLEDPDPAPVIRYETDDPTPPPLRVGVAQDFVNGRATIPDKAVSQVPQGQPGALDMLATQEETWSMRVTQNLVRAPQLPTPFATTAIRGEVPTWNLDQGAVARTDGPSPSYELDYVEPPEDTERVLELTTAAEGGAEPDLGPEREIAGELTALLDEIVDPEASDLEAAQAIQGYLRGNDFTYDLDLLPSQQGEHPVSRFLRTKQGYCQQFAATMVQLALARGIPARFVVGFLPGTPDVDGGRVVRAADAHAWPELFIAGVGWLRFEPTPGNRAASVPGYSIERTEETTSTSTTTSTTSESPSEASTDPSTAAGDETGSTLSWARPLLLVLALLALLAVLPLTALVLRERARRPLHDPADRVEADWSRLLADLGDLGIEAPVGATPRQSAQHLVDHPGVGSRQAPRLRTVVGAVERARYAPPGGDIPDIGGDVDQIVRRVRHGRSRSRRLRATLVPASALTWWRDLPWRLAARLRGLVGRRASGSNGQSR